MDTHSAKLEPTLPRPPTVRERYPSTVHFIIASAILSPLLVVSYLPIRSRLLRLGRDVRAGTQSIAALRQDLARVTDSEARGLRTEVEQLRTERDVAQQQMLTLRADLDVLSQSIARLESESKSLSGQLETLRSTRLSPDAVDGIGDSLGAVACVLEEMEVTFGLQSPAGWDRDPRGIAAMRQTALLLKAIAHSTPPVAPLAKNSPHE
ncbi:hypothetical protein BKA62DRAFT_690545 [Auriculariales sp. MPI-PUGE-AT-0066]|nr:hypothetical protein BKA62DRAFT_690545 [Auriculariales sp. MPI-PUGE-AT-0066]